MTSPAITLMDELANRGVTLAVQGDRLRYHPKAAVTPDLLARLKEHKATVVMLVANGSSPWWPPDSEPPDEACPICGSFMAWWDIRGDRHCQRCDGDGLRRSLAVADRAARLRGG